MQKLNILLIKQGKWWVAQALEVDVAAQAESVEDVLFQIERQLVSEWCVAIQHQRTPFEDIAAAPQYYWTQYRKARSLKAHPAVPFRPATLGYQPPHTEVWVA